ncbi:MAG: DUF6883 domain-containing protein [Saprospiraceae bacterium]
MKVPNCENAIAPLEKISGYLLNHDHSDGGSKARFFSQLGFDQQSLSTMLQIHISEHDFTEITTTKYGIKYAILGFADSPLGIRFHLKSIWIVPNNETIPQLVTAYPSKK